MRQALGADTHRLVHNADGANLHAGIASALSEHPRADLAVLETDERGRLKLSMKAADPVEGAAQ